MLLHIHNRNLAKFVPWGSGLLQVIPAWKSPYLKTNYKLAAWYWPIIWASHQSVAFICHKFSHVFKKSNYFSCSKGCLINTTDWGNVTHLWRCIRKKKCLRTAWRSLILHGMLFLPLICASSYWWFYPRVTCDDLMNEYKACESPEYISYVGYPVPDCMQVHWSLSKLAGCRVIVIKCFIVDGLILHLPRM